MLSFSAVESNDRGVYTVHGVLGRPSEGISNRNVACDRVMWLEVIGPGSSLAVGREAGGRTRSVTTLAGVGCDIHNENKNLEAFKIHEISF
jgi:hypothetical protein